ncbi:MAG: VCBS repeat-containing protein [Myxococcota bacterium]|nr:VCBS repeat-containing protein [Myxococcota bacterium]
MRRTLRRHFGSRALVRAAAIAFLAAGAAAVSCAETEGTGEDIASIDGEHENALLPPVKVSDSNGDGNGVLAVADRKHYVTVFKDFFLHQGGRRMAPDFNGDGYGDLAVAGGSDYVNVFDGIAAGVSTTPTKTITAPEKTSGTFYGIANAGDVNGDFFDDLIVGSNKLNKAYIYFGGAAGLPSAPSQTISAPTDALGFGYSAIGGLDFNNDNYEDVVIGAPGTKKAAGQAYVFYGSAAGLNSAPSLTLAGSGEELANFGAALAVGDINNDAYADLVVSENQNNFHNPQTGRVYVYMGTASSLPASPTVALTCPDGAQNGFGVSVAIVNDFDGDKLRDLAVGAYGVNSNDGRVYLYRGTSTGVSETPDVTLAPTDSARGYFGFKVLAGDFNNDLYGDLAVGETDADGMKGRVHVYYGGPLPFTPTSANHVTISGTHTDTGYFGQGMTTMQLGGGLYDDLIVGAPGTDGRAGRVYVFPRCGTGVETTASSVIYGPNGSNTAFGKFFAY